MTKLAIQVLMHSHDSDVNGLPRFSWYRPANIRIRLHNPASGEDKYLETNSRGVARRTLTVEADYDAYLVGLPGFFCLTQLPAGGALVNNPQTPPTVPVHGPQTEHQLHVFPDGGKWLVPLRLTLASPTAGSSTAIAGARVTVTDGAGNSDSFTSLADGSVYATGPAGEVTVQPEEFASLMPVPSDFVMRTDQEQEAVEVRYMPMRASIAVRAALGPAGPAIPGVTFELSRDGQEVPLREVTQGSQACVFSDLDPGQVTVRIISPTTYDGSLIKLIGLTEEVSVNLAAGENVDVSQYFLFEYHTGKARGRIRDSSGQPAPNISLIASSNGLVARATTGADGRYTLGRLRAGRWTIMLDQSAIKSGSQTLIAQPSQQVVSVASGKTAKANFKLISDEHGIRGQVTDSQGNPLPNAIVEIRDQRMRVIDMVVSNARGAYSWKSPSPGMFVVNLLTQDGRTVQREVVTVSSWATKDLVAMDRPDDSGGSQGPSGTTSGGEAGGGAAPGPVVREAVTDLAAYPVLTEEVSTMGPPAPAAGGIGGGGARAGYGQAVDQVIRDVLGWRPGGDVAGFQAALTGAFQLRDKEGHTEWTWQQRGYAVQADMGALTGAQASIYARAKAALDQIQPLLASVTALNPNLYPPEDLEAIRTVIAAEIQELVSELALEGGPRIQRVNELFTLLVGESRKSFDPNPDHVQGQLGKMRARFGLTEEWVETIDDERILTNFRVVVEQVLSLLESWFYDRKLLSVMDSNSSLGTILIWLSRGLEAVCESVDDLTFALDSVYVDAAQRQVIVLELPGQAPLLLSDLLDWYVRAARDEGPRLIQDAGRDGVNAFAPVLRKLRTLSQQTQDFIHSPQGKKKLPDGMQTSRVQRAFQVLEAQLIEAARLAGLVEDQSHDQAPEISYANVDRDTDAGEITVTMLGTNFRKGASAFLLPADRADIADVPARNTTVQPPGQAVGTFRIPRPRAAGQRVTWQVVLVNEDGTQSNPADINIPKHGDMGP
jgi:Carboxypeptidase regulatory-like domain